ncbi:HET-domain-containing protein [Paramyrothecium foliicola]|nr:HET-domain-containing protein [Paramyrothecium foliicola]
MNSLSNELEQLNVEERSSHEIERTVQQPESNIQQMFHYSPINEPESIRLLLLHPGSNEDPLKGSLHQVKFTEIAYEALSYCWGSPEMDCILDLDGRWLPITESLSSALKRLRYEGQARLVWADAICINQVDLKEKSKQIVLMPEIYASAVRVVVHLGEAADDSDDAIELLGKIAKADLRHASAVSIPSYFLLMAGLPRRDDPTWTALLKFWLRPWFSRIWVVQEVTLGREILFICGRSEMDWQPINAATEKMTKLGLLTDLFGGEEDPNLLMDVEFALGNVSCSSQRCFKLDVVFRSSWLLFEDKLADTVCIVTLKTRAQRRVGSGIFDMFRSYVDSHEGWTDIINYMGLSPEMQGVMQLYRENPYLLPYFETALRAQLGPVMDQLQPSHHGILQLLRMTLHCESTDPRDRIYALLGIAKDVNQDNFAPDYNESAEKIVLRLSRLLVEQGQGINLLYHCWMLPSSPLTFTQSRNWENIRSRTRMVVGLDDNGVKKKLPSWTQDWANPNCAMALIVVAGGIEDLYQAATREEPELTLGNDDVLHTSGYYLGQCDDLEETELSEYTINWPAYFEELDNFIRTDADAYFNGEPWSEVQWRLLCVNKNMQPSQAPPQFAAQYHHFREVMEQTKFSGEYTPEQLQLIVDMMAGNMWLKCFKNNVICFKPARTREGYIGMVPRATATTDQICFVKGANMPFVLRPVVEKEGHYRMVGPCYVHGLMSGEALDLDLKAIGIAIE